jgi:transcriptional regulator with XRE-family HTH domain
MSRQKFWHSASAWLRSGKRRGLTQIELAKAAETTQRAISYYENGSGVPNRLCPLARALRVTTDELLGVKPAKLDQGKRRSRRLWERFQRMASLPDRDQRAVIRLINSLATPTVTASLTAVTHRNLAPGGFGRRERERIVPAAILSSHFFLAGSNTGAEIG